MPLKLIADTDNAGAWKALIAANYGEISLETTPDFVSGKDNVTPEFLELSPLGKVPVLVTDEGPIFESNAIARYVARLDPNTHLYGSSAFESALIEQWIDFAVSEIELPAKIWLYPILGLMENNQTATSKAKGDIRKILEILNEHLEDQTFLVGERITLADIVVSIHLFELFKRVLDPGFRKAFGNVARWYLTLVHQTQFNSVLGEVTLCEKMQVAAKAPQSDTPNEKKEKQPKPEKAEKAEKAEKVEKVEKPKPEKIEKPKKEEEEGEEGDDEVKDKRPPNPLDLLPPSPLNLDEWKRFYSNNDSAPASAWFWEHLDREGYSLWFAAYKYNDELESLLKTCNLIGGWFQRLDRLHKYGFGNAIITKHPSAPYHEITSIWLFRGQDIPQEMKNCDDCELHEWSKLNPDDPEVKTKVESFWAWAGSFDGHEFVQGKTFK